MKKIILLLFAFSLLTAVSQPKASIPTIAITKSMVENPTKLKMSELIDDISFIRLETNKASFVKSTKYMRYTKDFIYLYVNNVFTWDGKWKANIGLKGNGPYEEPGGIDCDLIAFKDGKFYSKGRKLIEYDINGKPTKKVRNSLGEIKATGTTLAHGDQLVAAGKYLFSPAADAVYFINPENLETVKRIELIPNKVISGMINQNSSGHISYYRDNVIYSRNFIDNVFYVKDQSLQPIFKLQIDKDIKIPIDYFHQINELFVDFANRGNKMREMVKGKGNVPAVWETNNYLFLQFNRFKEDGIKRYILYIVYDKKLKTSKVVRAEDFVNDIIEQGESNLQIIDEKIVMLLWPHEIFNIIAKKKKAGEKIHPKLAAIASQIKEGDNPVIFVGHLKK